VVIHRPGQLSTGCAEEGTPVWWLGMYGVYRCDGEFDLCTLTVVGHIEGEWDCAVGR
jgi:hypothetical protein